MADDRNSVAEDLQDIAMELLQPLIDSAAARTLILINSIGMTSTVSYPALFRRIAAGVVHLVMMPTLATKYSLLRTMVSTPAFHTNQMELQVDFESDESRWSCLCQRFLAIVDYILAVHRNIKCFSDSLSVRQHVLTEFHVVDTESHNSGESTVVFTMFDSATGSTSTHVYKPTPLRLMTALKVTLDLLLERRLTDLIRLPEVAFIGPDYTILEYVPHSGQHVTTSSDVHRFYVRCGAVLALAHFFRITDIHHENFVVSDGMPVPIDLEMIAHRYEPTALHSVDMTGIVNTRDRMTALQGGGAMVKFSPHYIVENNGLSVSNRTRVYNDANRLYHNGKVVDPSMYASDICMGFRLAMSEFTAHASSIVAYWGELAQQNCSGRHIIRPTKFYLVALHWAMQPEPVITETKDRTLRAWLLSSPALSPTNDDIVASEISALLRGDVPAFYCSTISEALATKSDVATRDYFPRTFRQLFRDHVASILRVGTTHQERLIFESLTPQSTRPATL